MGDRLLIGAVALAGFLMPASHAGAQQAAVPAPQRIDVTGGQFVLRGGLASPARTLALTAPPPAPFGEVASVFRHRLASNMVDVYPWDKIGLRISGGTRFYMRRNFWRYAEDATDGRLWAPRMPKGGLALGGGGGVRRYTPALTLGYDFLVTHDVLIGLEGGAVRGRILNAPPRQVRRLSDPLFGGTQVRRNQANPVLNFTAVYVF